MKRIEAQQGAGDARSSIPDKFKRNPFQANILSYITLISLLDA